jgi:hypothetical protein
MTWTHKFEEYGQKKILACLEPEYNDHLFLLFNPSGSSKNPQLHVLNLKTLRLSLVKKLPKKYTNLTVETGKLIFNYDLNKIDIWTLE